MTTDRDKVVEALTRLDVAHDQALTGSVQLSCTNEGAPLDQEVLSEVLDSLLYILKAHGWESPLEYTKGWVPRHFDRSYHSRVRMFQVVTDAQGAALAYAWDTLEHTAYDLGGCKIQFDQHEPGVWAGARTASTEEGYSSVYVDVHSEYDEVAKVDYWVIDVRTDLRDCDSRYTGGQSVTFRDNAVPHVEYDATRDHSAEQAGY